MKTLLFSILLLSTQQAFAQLQACGLANADFSKGCNKKAVQFDVTSCDVATSGVMEATQISCGKNEISATLKTGSRSYRVVFAKAGNSWQQKGKVWSFYKKNEAAASEATTGVATNASGVTSSVISSAGTLTAATAEAAAVLTTPPAPAPAEVATETAAAATSVPEVKLSSTFAEEPWKFKLKGWLQIENENIKNFGDQVSSATAAFNSNDPNNQSSNINALANLGFSAQKNGHQVVTLFEIGEVFFGESTSGGAQGLKSKNIKTKNLYVIEHLGGSWSMLAGLYTLSSDPNGFILKDNYAGLALMRQGDNSKTNFWFADASDGKPGVIATRDHYYGFIHTQGLDAKKNWSLFGVYRGTKENFIDSLDLTTEYTGKSEYMWIGFQDVREWDFGLKFQGSYILSNAKFKADSAAEESGSSDSVNGWMGNITMEQDLGSEWAIYGEHFMTSGASDMRSATDKKILGRRKSFASPNPSSAHLLTIATNDGLDEYAGSARAADRIIGRTDLDEGLLALIVGIKKSFGSTEALVRYGMLKSTVVKTATDSSAYGTETDLVLTHRVDDNASFVAEYGMFTPGKYFVNTDAATLLSLSYKLEF